MRQNRLPKSAPMNRLFFREAGIEVGTKKLSSRHMICESVNNVIEYILNNFSRYILQGNMFKLLSKFLVTLPFLIS